jgi:hypothetical protein
MDVDRNEEYESLRAEILAWQGRRIELLEISAGLVTAIVGLDLLLKPSLAGDWPLVSSILLIFLACAGFITWYAARGNAKAAGYIKVFHEGGQDKTYRWETRLGKLKAKGVDDLNINNWLALIYLSLAFIAVLIPALAASPSQPSKSALVALAVCSVIETISLVLMFCYSYPRETYEEHWKRIREEESRDG